MATRLPAAFKETEMPDRSFAASPSISLPSWVQLPLLKAYTLTWPELIPLPSLYGAPMAIRSPAAFRETDQPDSSLLASPLTSLPVITILCPTKIIGHRIKKISIDL